MDRAGILRRVLVSHYYQPATALWRAVEVETILRHVRFRGRVLDLGCGDGGIGAVVMPVDCTLLGLDSSAEDLGMAQALGRYHQLCLGDAGAMPYAGASFDMIFSNSVLEHIPHLDRTLSEVGRVLRPGGEFTFTVPSDHFIGWLKWPSDYRLHGQADRAETYIGELNARLQHYHYLAPADWSKKLASAGMRLEKHVYYMDRRILHSWETWHYWTGRLAWKLSGDRLSPREIQTRYRLPAIRRLVPVGLLVQVLFIPLWASLKRRSEDCDVGACLLIRAAKAAGPGGP